MGRCPKCKKRVEALGCAEERTVYYICEKGKTDLLFKEVDWVGAGYHKFYCPFCHEVVAHNKFDALKILEK